MKGLYKMKVNKLMKKLTTLLLSVSLSIPTAAVSNAAEGLKDDSVYGYLAVYPAKYEPDLGAEYAQFPSKQYMDTYRTDVLYYALSSDGKNFTALNNNKAVFSPERYYKLGSPNIYRTSDGYYGLIASVDNKGEEVIVCDSDELIYFYNQRRLRLNDEGISVMNPKVEYDKDTNLYNIFWEGSDGNSYVNTTESFVTVSEHKKVEYAKEKVTATLPDYAVADEASIIPLTKEEYDRLNNKFGKMHSVAVDIKDYYINPGESVTLPDKVDVVYNNGTKVPMGIKWNTESTNLTNLAKGEYEVTGTIQATAEYNSPLANYRADPYAIYDEENEVYYFTGSNLNENSANGGGAYENLVIRVADSLNDIAEAEEYVVWRDKTLPDGTRVTGWYWAPEIHKIGGKWRMIALAQVTEPGGNGSGRQCIFTCVGDDITDANCWEYTGYIHNTTDNQSVGSFDTTYFEYDGQSYYVTPKNSNIWITTVDPEDPLHPTGPLVKLSGADRAFESNIGSGNAGYGNIGGGIVGQAIQEASSVLIHDDKIFIAYAGCTIDMMYCVCLLYADLNSDFMDASSWKKYPYPILATQDLTTTIKQADYTDSDGTTNVTGSGDSGLNPGSLGEYEGTFGPGHNSFTVDENGNPVIIYHARDWQDSYPGATGSNKYGLVDPGRHAYAKQVLFDSEGFPVCNLSPEEYLAEELKTVKVKIYVGKETVTPQPDIQPPTATPPADSVDAVKVGDIKKAGRISYKVKNVDASGNGTVAVLGVSKKSVKKITVPKFVKINGHKFKVTEIAKKAFAGCKKLKKITVKSTTLKKVGKNALKNTSDKLVIVCPKKKLKMYKKLFTGKGNAVVKIK